MNEDKYSGEVSASIYYEPDQETGKDNWAAIIREFPGGKWIEWKEYEDLLAAKDWLETNLKKYPPTDRAEVENKNNNGYSSLFSK